MSVSNSVHNPLNIIEEEDIPETNSNKYLRFN